MKIKAKIEGRTRYYVAVSNGRVIVDRNKGRGVDLPPPIAAKVLEHLRILDARFADAEVAE